MVPYTRGQRAQPDVVVGAGRGRRIADLGYTEIQLLGQNVNSYRDPEGKLSFAELLAAVGQVPGIRRVRFTTSHPRDFTRDIVEAIDAFPTLCDHVHLPVQSGSSRVLKMMAREYTPRLVPGADQLDQGGAAANLAFDGHHRRLSGGDAGRLHPDHGPAGGGAVRLRVRLQVLGAAQHSGADDDRFDSGCREGATTSSVA